jgi:hypothetical protein
MSAGTSRSVALRIEEFLTAATSLPHSRIAHCGWCCSPTSSRRPNEPRHRGDERWRALLQRFGEITDNLADPCGGTVLKSTGDGHLVTFDGPTQAIRYAEALCRDAETLGIDIRIGIHTGECERLDADIGGLAVHIAARILGHADAGEILVSRTVRDLVVGSGIAFDDHGTFELRGVPGIWELLTVDRHGAQADSAEARLSSMPTPGPRAAMRPADGAVGAMARRTPWILRGVARIAPMRATPN